MFRRKGSSSEHSELIEFRDFAHLIGKSPQVTSVDFTEVDATADSADSRTVRLVAVAILELLCGFQSRETT